MSSQPSDPPPHRVAAFADRLDHALEGLAQSAVWSMSAAEQRHSLLTLARAEAKLAALRLRLLAQAESSGACTADAAVDAGAWVAGHTRVTRRDARADLTLAVRLESLPVLAEAMATGGVNLAQARAVVRCLDRLPVSGEFATSPEQRAQAEAHLVGLCASHDATEITILGRRIFEVIAPEAAEAYETKQLAAQEAKAARKTSLEFWVDPHGICHGRFQIPALHAEMLRTAIWALTNPVRHAAPLHSNRESGIDPDLPAPVRHGVAFTQILEALQAHWLPTHGGVGATVVVTMTHEQLLADLDTAGIATLDTGGVITAAQARRLACGAGIIPVVLGSRSVVLDAGTKTRFHTEPMRHALAIRDGGCTAQGCDVPAAMCHAHHDTPFSRGGPTSVANGRLLCGHHHRRIHDPQFTHQQLPDGKLTFHRRT